MKEPFPTTAGRAARLGQLLLVTGLVMSGLPARAQGAATNPSANPADPADADKAWRDVIRATTPPWPPAEWQQKPPTKEEQAKFYVPALEKGADKARDFYTRFPADPHSPDARKKEFDLLAMAAEHYRDTNVLVRISALEAERLKDPGLGEDERFKLRMTALQRLMAGMPGTKEEFLKAVAALQKDFPKKTEVYQLLLSAAESAEGPEKLVMIQAIVDNPDAPDPVKAMARGILHQAEALGKPLDIRFTAVDGREVDLAKLKGKVVLIDFWATWCGPCVGELPNVKAAYDKLHGQGFEIVGISFDQKQEDLEKFVKEKEMAWPQYFDGKVWKNDYGVQFGINAIPAMWLVDRAGNLRDMNARGELEEKAAKLLAEH